MLKKIVGMIVISQLAFAAPGDPVTLEITPERQHRNAERQLDALRALADHPTETLIRNGDQELFPADYRGNFGKSLTWNDTTFHKAEYDKLLTAIASGNPADFAALTGGATPDSQVFKLVNPQAAFSFDCQGADQWSFAVPPAPALQSAEAAGEMVELYWHALLRDVPFNNYGTDADALTAVSEIDGLTDFKGPKDTGSVTAGTLFRGVWSGDLVGPYVSQFLYLPVLYGPGPNYNGSGAFPKAYQEFVTPTAGSSNNFMTTEAEWENIQKGKAPAGTITFDGAQRYFIRNGRDLGEYVHNDTPAQVAADTALILLSFGSAALDDAMFYKNSADNQAGFVTFGPVSIITQVVKVVELALKAAWFQKWYVHRRLRPEAFGYLIEKQATGALSSGLHADIMNSTAVANVRTANGNRLLPLAYPEGSPCHPSYPAGHATLAGAVSTVLKAFFKEDFVIPDPVQPNSANTDLEAYAGPALTIGGELNKLASNISIGRNTAGVHYRTDGTEGMLLGEKVAIKFLQDLGATYNENFTGFSLTKFDGTVITGLGAKK